MNMTALLSDWYPLGQGSHAKSEFDMWEVSRNPLRLMTSILLIYIVHFNARKCSEVCARSLAIHSTLHHIRLRVSYNDVDC